ncbi:hypothetical protein C7212DRAFT_61700, partial [Tuber magnatum]
RFFDYCLNVKIIPFCLPAHSTHLLQPLDVRLFSPLQRHYGNGLDEFVRNCHAETNYLFYSILMPARQLAFTSSNIQSAWEAEGIIPFNPRRVLGAVKR